MKTDEQLMRAVTHLKGDVKEIMKQSAGARKEHLESALAWLQRAEKEIERAKGVGENAHSKSTPAERADFFSA